MTDKFISPCPKPAEYEAELLTILIEECAEVQQRATKMLRFGVNEIQPGQELTNVDRLSLECGDLTAIGDLCIEAGLINSDLAEKQVPVKQAKLKKFLQSERPHE